jgi:hypothetical protein
MSIGGVFVLVVGVVDYGLEQSIVVPAIPALAREYPYSLIGTSFGRVMTSRAATLLWLGGTVIESALARPQPLQVALERPSNVDGKVLGIFVVA